MGQSGHSLKKTHYNFSDNYCENVFEWPPSLLPVRCLRDLFHALKNRILFREVYQSPQNTASVGYFDQLFCIIHERKFLFDTVVSLEFATRRKTCF